MNYQYDAERDGELLQDFLALDRRWDIGGVPIDLNAFYGRADIPERVKQGVRQKIDGDHANHVRVFWAVFSELYREEKTMTAC